LNIEKVKQIFTEKEKMLLFQLQITILAPALAAAVAPPDRKLCRQNLYFSKPILLKADNSISLAWKSDSAKDGYVKESISNTMTVSNQLGL
jgi:hypothetical protein